MKHITLTDKQLKIVLAILKKYPYAFYAYGSRTQGKSRPTSDLDICFFDFIPLSVQSHIDLPFRVEISDYNLMTEEFQALIKKDLVPLMNNE